MSAPTALRNVWGLTIPERRLAIFFESLGHLISTGVSIPESLLKASAMIDDELASICRVTAPKLREGVPLHQALEPYRQRFPEMVLPILEVGEVSGTLDDAAYRLGKVFHQIDGFSKKFKDVKIEPLKVAGGAIFFRCVFAAGTDPMQILKLAVITVVEVFVTYGIYRYVHRNLYRWRKLHILVDKIHLAIPHVGAIERSVASARWARSFGTMWNAGVPISQALEVSSRSSLNAYYEVQIMKAAELTRQGKGLAESLSTMELTPRHLLPILSIGEKSADFGKALDVFVDAMEEEAIVKAQQESQAAMLTMYLIMAFLAALLALGTSLPGLVPP